jgi:O-antigen/teichoic acid export membrane protein
MGLVLAVVLGRLLGEAGSGVVMQAVGVFMIALGISRFGMDSSAIWLLPRLAMDAPTRVALATWFMIAVSGAAGAVCAAVMIAASTLIAADDAAADAIAASAWFLPVTSMLLTALAATRGLGGVAAYVWVGNVILPTLRPLAIIAVVALGGGAVAATVAWAAPGLATLFMALAVLVFQLRGLATTSPATAPTTGPTTAFFASGVPRTALRYAGPRVVSSTLEQVLAWVGIILVGALAGPTAAGIYAAASRFSTSGMIVDTAIRVAVSPLFSRLHHRGEVQELTDVYRRATTWLVLFSAPVFILMAVYAPVALHLLGPGFTTGATVLAVMCVGAMVTLMAGNIHSILLMGGNSGLAALNKVVAVSVNVLLILALTPAWGIVGAALGWVVSCLLDAAMATYEVHRFMHIRLPLTSGIRPLLVAVTTVGLPAVLIRILMGPTLIALAVTVVVGGVLFVSWCLVDHSRLHLNKPGKIRERKSSHV